MNRIAILIDRENLFESLNQKKPQILDDGFLPIAVWSEFNQMLLKLVAEQSNLEEPRHMGTWMFVSKRVDLHGELNKAELEQERKFLDQMKAVDSLYGFIIKYGIGYKKGDKLHSKGVDVNLVCQMLVGAFEDKYDICVLVSDDDDFIPAVEIVQNFYGKQVYHAGFQGDRLRAACYGNVDLEGMGFKV